MIADFFSIFDPDWWMDENNNALQIADAILFLIMALPVLYLFICALFSLGKYKNPYPDANVKHRFLVLFTVLRNGKEVIHSIIFLIHNYILVINMTLQWQQPNCRKKTSSLYCKCQ